MRKKYFTEIVKYTKDVYNVEEGLRNLKDERKNPTYKINKVILPVLLGFIISIRSFNELNNMIKAKTLKNFRENMKITMHRYNS